MVRRAVLKDMGGTEGRRGIRGGRKDATQVRCVRSFASTSLATTRQRGGGGGADWRRRRTAAPGRDPGVAAAVSTVACISCFTADCILEFFLQKLTPSQFKNFIIIIIQSQNRMRHGIRRSLLNPAVRGIARVEAYVHSKYYYQLSQGWCT